MSWNGYFRYGDTEIINTTRTEAYAEALGMHWVKNVSPDGRSSDALGALLGETYSHPALDTAPWYDPDSPESGEFAGLIPLDVDGLDDSTRSSDVFEYTTDGGNPGTLRHSTKPVVYSVALIGASECAVEYGFRWLKRALTRRNCTPGTTVSCRGEALYFARCMPVGGPAGSEILSFDGGTPALTGSMGLDGGSPGLTGSLLIDGGSPEDFAPSPEWLTDYERHLNNVVINRGPIVNSKRTVPGCNGAVWLVSFTAVAGDPFIYGSQLQVLEGLGQGTDPYVGPFTGAWGSTTYTAAGCVTPTYQPLYDPLYPALVNPPSAPDIPPAGFVTPSGVWQRRYAEIPAEVIPLWDEVRPILVVRSEGADARMVRVRFYPEYVAPDDDCDAVGEFLITYIPQDVYMFIDTVLQTVYVYDAVTGITRRADSLVLGSAAATPIKWFGLSCGDAYRMTVDWDTDTTPDLDVDLYLVPRSA